MLQRNWFCGVCDVPLLFLVLKVDRQLWLQKLCMVPFPSGDMMTSWGRFITLKEWKKRHNILLLSMDKTMFGTHFWQVLHTFEAPLPLGMNVSRHKVEQKSAGEPFLWNAVCPFTRCFPQWEQNMCCNELDWSSPPEVTENTDPIFRSSWRRQNQVRGVHNYIYMIFLVFLTFLF